MSLATPLKLVAGLIVELGGFGLILFGVPLLLARFGAEPQLATVDDPQPEWTAYYQPAPPALFVPPPLSAMAELGRPRIVASQLQTPRSYESPSHPAATYPATAYPAAMPFPAPTLNDTLEPLPQEKYVARTLDAASQKLVNEVGGYLYDQVDQVFADPRGQSLERPMGAR